MNHHDTNFLEMQLNFQIWILQLMEVILTSRGAHFMVILTTKYLIVSHKPGEKKKINIYMLNTFYYHV